MTIFTYFQWWKYGYVRGGGGKKTYKCAYIIYEWSLAEFQKSTKDKDDSSTDYWMIEELLMTYFKQALKWSTQNNLLNYLLKSTRTI